MGFDSPRPLYRLGGRTMRSVSARLTATLAALVALLLLAAPVASARTRSTRTILPRPPAAQGAQIVRLFEQVDRNTVWKLVDQVHLQAETWHTEGIVKLGSRWVVSSVQVTEPTVKYQNGQIINGTDRTAGAGFGHLMSFDAQ